MGMKPRRAVKAATAKGRMDIAEKLVQSYLNECGGADCGFTIDQQERALILAIARELKQAAGV